MTPSRRPSPSVVVPVRFNVQDHARLRELAAGERLPLSTYLRRVVLLAADRAARKVRR